ncbi:hypothetical protein X777_08705 [Ooceraea biroi]|uniref:Uncharacterized protein n=1 Tax=Ooceraea biroi TaxID=2015173 RepID=A0A026W7W6_OOCBI|nr:hypothetical protein X777_08705 [Ooceraea biroi]
MISFRMMSLSRKNLISTKLSTYVSAHFGNHRVEGSEGGTKQKMAQKKEKKTVYPDPNPRDEKTWLVNQ